MQVRTQNVPRLYVSESEGRGEVKEEGKRWVRCSFYLSIDSVVMRAGTS